MLQIFDKFGMHAQVPQFIDIEDKIVGPFTLKQFGYLAGGSIAIGIMYTVFQFYIVIILGLPIIFLSLALAFYKINGRPFIFYLMSFFNFGLKQHIYIWEKPLEEYDIFIQQKTTEKQPLIFERITEFAQTSLKKAGWSLNVFGKKTVIPQTEISEQEEKYNESPQTRV
ncbi:MAG: hypothetical protein US79_C0003G0054 [Parcubacteria group bacterium GW2011_GWC1_38_17]|nr:MAG: hypothetical protein US79_C0003G0054 [Parcubacteria group bacterium GW2011_GWC1_38_17]